MPATAETDVNYKLSNAKIGKLISSYLLTIEFELN